MSSARRPARKAGGLEEHRSATPSTSTSSPTPATTASCPQCNSFQSTFYCTVCLSERLILQHADHRRVREARQTARSRVEALLGASVEEVTSRQEALADPFGEPEKRVQRGGKYSSRITAPHYGASSQDRTARAVRARLEAEIGQGGANAERARKEASEGRRRVAERRLALARRRALLNKAEKSVRAEDERDLGQTVTYDRVERFKEEVTNLQAESKEVAEEVARARARLAREVFALFDVRAPSSSLANARTSGSKPPSNNRNQRSKERYMTGAFAIDFSNAFDLGRSFRETKAKEEVSRNVNDWTILGLVLPLPSDVRRFDRGEVNGAISHTVQLLQLVIAYLGITLPFIVSMQADLPQIRANPLWGSGVKESLHLSASTYNALVATASGSGAGGMGASMMSNLGASTLSTLESFVQLPSGKGMPWAKNNPAEPLTKVGGQAGGGGSEQSSRGGEGEDAASLSGKRFCSALTMLSYDVAYLAHLQGVKPDLVLAAGSMLRLLSKAMQSADLGTRSHTTLHPLSNIPNLQFSTLEFVQLLQIHEPGCNSASLGEDLVGKSTEPSPIGKSIMEGSYVDAKAALDNRTQSSSTVGPTSRASTSPRSLKRAVPDAPAPVAAPAPATSTKSSPAKQAAQVTPTVKVEKMSSLAAKRVPSTLSLGKSAKPKEKSSSAATPSSNTLDFLRARGEREQKDSQSPIKAQASPSTNRGAPVPVSSGTIIFNGREIKGKAKGTRVDRTKPDEEGWDVV